MASSSQDNNSTGPRLVDRPRLIAKLSQVVQHRLTLISAPPGYGKTTLASQFINQSPLPLVWHTIDPSQRDVPILHHRALSILDRLAPGIQELPQSYGFPPYELATHLTEYLNTHLGGEAIYVLDDVHLLDQSPPAETWLRTLVEQMPPNCHIVIISRTLPDIPLTEMIARREVLAIGQEELRFRRDEVYELATQLRGEFPTEDEVEDLEMRLEGWPAGTLLALQPLPEDIARMMLRGGAGPEDLFYNLAESMLQTQPEALRNFLLTTSTLSRITPELCTRVLGIQNSESLFVQAMNRNMFLTRVTGGLAYHTLFRNFLQRHFKQISPEWFIDLHLRAAQWFEANDQIIEALEHYFTADDLQGAAQLADRAAQTFFTQGKHETVLGWSRVLQQVWDRVPNLLCVSAKILYSRYLYDEGDTYLEAAEHYFGRYDDHAGLVDARVVRCMMHLQRGQYNQAEVLARQVIEQDRVEPYLRGRALASLGTALVHLGDVATGISHLEAAVPYYEDDGDIYALSSMLMNLEFAYRRGGRQQEAAACLQRVVALRRQLGSAGPLALALNNLGFHYHQHSDYQQALATFQEGLTVVARVPIQRTESYLYWSMADLQRDRGTFSEALQHYERALDLIKDSEPSLRAAILFNMAVLYRWQNSTQQAVAYATEASALAANHDMDVVRLQSQAIILAARAENDPRKSLRKLQAIVQELRRRGLHVELMQVLGWCATVAATDGDTSAAEDFLREALEIAGETGSAQVLAAEVYHAGIPGEAIRSYLPNYELLTRDLQKITQAQYQLPKPVQMPSPTDVSGQETFSIRVQTLGQEYIDRDGIRLTTADWRAAARELFLYILFHKEVTKEQINLAFWPDSDSKKVRNLFHTTIYRVRQALGDNVIVFEDPVYRINPLVDIWCDAQEFETAATQAKLLPTRDPRTEDLWNKAVELYQGEFLQSVDAEWADIRRETLREFYIEALMGLGKCARTRDDFRAALNAYKRALDEEPYREDINRAIMICYADLGEKHQIISHLDKLKHLLRTELAVEPSPETIELANRLLA